MRTRTFVLAGLLVTLVLAGVVSFYASGHPDGLEFVAERTGFSQTAEESPVTDGPLADYSVTGVRNERLAGGLAGVAGVLVTLVGAGALGYAVRRRSAGAERPPPANGP